MRPSDVAFPPRDLPFDFRNQLEAKYRDGLHRSTTTTYVDIEGDIVWTQEYLRYRVNGCDHQTATSKVFSQIDGGGIAPVCSSSNPSGEVPFPPRNEPFAFRQQLEDKYRNQLRRPAGATYVDLEGDIVWTQEYLRYMVNGCDHANATSKVFAQIDGRGVQPLCTAAPVCTWQYVAVAEDQHQVWNVSATATTRQIAVTTSSSTCAWSVLNAASLPSWVTVQPSSGSGSGTITISIASNATGSARAATLEMDPAPTNCSPFCSLDRQFHVNQSR